MELYRFSNLPVDVVAAMLSEKLPKDASVRQNGMTKGVRVEAGHGIYELHVDNHQYRITDAGGTGFDEFDFSDLRTFSFIEDAVRAMARLAVSDTFGLLVEQEDGTETLFNVPSWTLPAAAAFINDPDSDWWYPGEARIVLVHLGSAEDAEFGWCVTPCGPEKYEGRCGFTMNAHGIIPGCGARYLDAARSEHRDASRTAA